MSCAVRAARARAGRRGGEGGDGGRKAELDAAENADKESKVKRMAQYMGLQDMDKGASRDMLKKLEAMGIETPEDLQRLFNRRAVDILGGQALSLGIDAFALTGCFTLHQYAGSLQQPFQFGLDAVSFGLGALFGSQLIGGLVALGASTTAALLFG